MPSVEQILSGLKEISNRWIWLAIFWHVYFGPVLLATLLKCRPSKRVVGIALSLEYSLRVSYFFMPIIPTV